MNLDLPSIQPAIQKWCKAWRVKECSIFGSAIREDFSPVSDVDVLVEYLPGTSWSDEDAQRILEQLERIVGRRVDLVEKRLLRNPFIRYDVLSSRRVLYAA
jgi:uncharacterized protein